MEKLQIEETEPAKKKRMEMEKLRVEEAESKGFASSCAASGRMGMESLPMRGGSRGKSKPPWGTALFRDTDMKAALAKFAVSCLAIGTPAHKANDRSGARNGAAGKSVAGSQQQSVCDALNSIQDGFLSMTFAQLPGSAKKASKCAEKQRTQLKYRNEQEIILDLPFGFQ